MTGSATLRAIRSDDVPDVLRLNAEHVELLSPLDEGRLSQLLAWATRADVITYDGGFVGFVLVFGPGSPYDSPNYQWFSEHFSSGFHYLDRIVVDDRFRRRGLASAVYDEVEAAARASGRLALEVNLDPPNVPSLAFHQGRGYTEVGQLGPLGHRVTLMAKQL